MQIRTIFFSLIILTFLASSPLINPVNASPELWSKTYGGTDSETAFSLVETSDGGFALTGDGLLVKTDANGNMAWNKTYFVLFRSLTVTSDGGFALAGDSSILKIDGQGNVEWNKTCSISANSLIETSDEGYALCGDVNLVKIDPNGNEEWCQMYGETYREIVHSLVQTSDGGYALAGQKSDVFWLVKTDAYGNLEWSQTYGSANALARSLVVTSDGGFALAGYTYSWDSTTLGVGNYDFWLVKTDSDGVMEWNQTYLRADKDIVHSLIVTSDGGFALVGESYVETFSSVIDHDFWLVKTDPNGNMEWNQTYGGTNHEIAYSVVQTADGGYALAGYTSSYGAGNKDFWLIKTDSRGIPEFPSWAILPLLFIASFTAIIYKKKIICNFISN